MSIPLLVVMTSLVFAYVQIHQIIHTKYVQFLEYQLTSIGWFFFFFHFKKEQLSDHPIH